MSAGDTARNHDTEKYSTRAANVSCWKGKLMRQILFPGAYVCTQAIFAATVVATLCGRLSAAVIFESALPIEPQPDLQVGILIGGTPTHQIYGAAFSIPHTVRVESIGGFMFGSGPNPDDLFGAIIRLPSIDGFPSGNPFNTSEVMAHTAVFQVADGLAHEVTVPLAVTLEAGAYAVVFGDNQFGAKEGTAAAPDAGGNLNSHYIAWNTSLPGWQRGTWNARFFVLGTVPEPSAAMLVVTAAAVCRFLVLGSRVRCP